MLLIALRKGGGPCSKDCPFYTETGVVRGFNGSLKTHCRMTMNPWMIDCDLFDTHHIFKMEVTEEQFKQMQKAVHKRAIRQRKLYPEKHENANQVGCEWTRSRSATGSQESIPLRLIDGRPVPPLSPCETSSFCGGPDKKGKWNAEKSSKVKK